MPNEQQIEAAAYAIATVLGLPSVSEQPSFKRAARAALEAAERAPVPAGWKLVPAYPDVDMQDAACRELFRQYHGPGAGWSKVRDVIDDLDLIAIYRAMLDAAPTPEQQG
jgi:hypothetical protein